MEGRENIKKADSRIFAKSNMSSLKHFNKVSGKKNRFVFLKYHSSCRVGERFGRRQEKIGAIYCR